MWHANTFECDQPIINDHVKHVCINHKKLQSLTMMGQTLSEQGYMNKTKTKAQQLSIIRFVLLIGVKESFDYPPLPLPSLCHDMGVNTQSKGMGSFDCTR